MSGSGPDPEFDFTSSWQLSTGLETVWETLIDFHSWPRWWPALESVEETSPGGPDGIGQSAKSVWHGPLGYRLGFEIETIERVHPNLLKGKASGELSGTGTWHLSPVTEAGGSGPEWTRIVYQWRVVVSKRWMRFLNPVARPVFVYSHDHVMKKGAEGMAEYLGCEIRDFSAESG